MRKRKTILVAPLNWGLGHATRCIPIIKALQEHNYKVLIASDGPALLFLQKEFPEVPSIELPGYDITYTRKGVFFKFKILMSLPKIKKTISTERNLVKQLVASGRIDGIISDNRIGVRNKKIPSVYITHQLNVLSGNTSFLSSRMHQKVIKKYNECWVPDMEGTINLSGRLGHPKDFDFPVKYMGPLSRMQKKEISIKYDILALLSGPEPQRSLLEIKLVAIFQGCGKEVLLIRGVVEEAFKVSKEKNITTINFLQSSDLEMAINQSKIVVSRPGYTTIMDLTAMEKDAFFIPTPGQYEQIYLAKELKEKGIVPSCKQENFKLENLGEVSIYKGLKCFKNHTKLDYGELFGLFESE